MDIKTLSTILGHSSGNTTLNTYAHASDNMKKTAAQRIDQGIAKKKVPAGADTTASTHTMTDFRPTKGIKRKWGTGSMVQLSDHRWRGYFTRKWPDGTTHFKNVYADTEEDCERLLREAIATMKAEIAAEKGRLKAG